MYFVMGKLGKLCGNQVQKLVVCKLGKLQGGKTSLIRVELGL